MEDLMKNIALASLAVGAVVKIVRMNQKLDKIYKIVTYRPKNMTIEKIDGEYWVSWDD